MKKTVCLILISSLIIICFGIWVQKCLEESSRKLSDNINEIDLLIKTNNMEIAIGENIKAKEKWDETKESWSMFIDHYEIDNIEEHFIRVDTLLKHNEDLPELLAEIQVLKFYIEHIPEREAFNLQNIL